MTDDTNPAPEDPTTPDDVGSSYPTGEQIQAENELIIYNTEKERKTKDAEVAAADAASQAAAEQAVQASLEEHAQTQAAHLEAVHLNNAAAQEAINALKKGKPLQNEDLPEQTIPSDLPAMMSEAVVCGLNTSGGKVCSAPAPLALTALE